MKIFSNYFDFINKIYEKLSETGVDTTSLKIDHLGYQANSKEDYDQKILEIDNAKIISENIVGGRRVGIFKLNTPLSYDDQEISVVEIFEPKEGQKVESRWEHIEFLVDGTLEDFMAKYPNIDWDVSALNREEFPMLILHLGDGLRAKFPRLEVLEEVKRNSSR